MKFIIIIITLAVAYLLVKITNKSTLKPDTIFMSTRFYGDIEDTISKDELTNIYENISVKENINILIGRQIWRLKPFTTGSKLKDFIPFFHYNNKYVLYDVASFKENMNHGAELGRYFNPFGLTNFMSAIFYVVSFILGPMILYAILLSFNPPNWLLFSILSLFCIFLLYAIYWDSFFFYGFRPFFKGTIIHIYVMTLFVNLILKNRKSRFTNKG